MVALYYNGNNITNKVLPSVKNALSKVKTADLICDELSIPTDFSYYNTLNRVRNNISSIKSDLINIENWLENSNKNINDCIEKLENNLSGISSGDIQVRKNIVL